MGDVRVELAGVRKVFGSTIALQGLSCTVRRGEIVGLLGPNGAGKTTTLRILLGMIKPSSGHATIDGIDCTEDARTVKSRLGYTPDEPAFYDFLTGKETVDFVLRVRGEDPAARWPSIEPITERLDFERQLGAAVGGYSHGMKKKLAVLPRARPCARRPRARRADQRPRSGRRGLASASSSASAPTPARPSSSRPTSSTWPIANVRLILVLHGGVLVAEGTLRVGPRWRRRRRRRLARSSLHEAGRLRA